MREPLAPELARAMSEARAETLRLFDLVREEEDLHVSPGFGFRPLAWHLAHVGVFEAFWLLQKLAGRPAPDERYLRVFDPISTPREDSKNLPARAEMEAYLARVREGVGQVLAETNFDPTDPLLRDSYVVRLVAEHELQHQETLAYLLQMLDPSKKIRPDDEQPGSQIPSDDGQGGFQIPTDEAAPPNELILVPAGECELGAPEESFAYDNERPAQRKVVPAFRIARLPVTNGEFARFVEEGGYERREFWDEEGWQWREREGWTHPLYWRRASGGAWLERTMFEESPLKASHPVVGVSWFEAEAYARFAGARLPSEAEWEKAASWDAAANRKRRFAWGDAAPDTTRCNFERRFWGTTPVGSFPAGASACVCLDMTGNVWEWTSDPFRGFPGFEAFPYPEYSETWFDGDHRVLKGGSWATSASVLRTSFRNFFRRPFRIAFAGLRLASDA
ncbi:MAG TPA: SUMF1/EgtB/PvdO family nonheme iron enzyme [Pyrinomonadaceae bacterium]|nr:SUMF1/EgtB/PvdO family nonheme iron enzyme [Pyrinomonadaceae bacterium]